MRIGQIVGGRMWSQMERTVRENARRRQVSELSASLESALMEDPEFDLVCRRVQRQSSAARIQTNRHGIRVLG